MKKILPFLAGILTMLLVTACPTGPMLSEEKEITAYSFTAAANSALSNDVTGTISSTDISLSVPYGTVVNRLVADFTTSGATVTATGNPQFSGNTANDFSSPATYRVTAEDGTTQDYTVTVNIAATAAEEGAGFDGTASPEDTGVLTLNESSETITMVYAQDQGSISFPAKTDDSGSATVTTKFWLAETEFTNTQAAEVLKWAYDNGRIVKTGGAHNEVNPSGVKYGTQKLIGFTQTHNRLNYYGGDFTVDSGFENHPLVRVTWYGAVMLCNWLTEMRDGHAGNLVYEGITTNWTHTDTTEDTLKNGYRLPSTDEWEYTARYLGTTEPSTNGVLDTERKYGNDDANWTDGYYWTPGNYASGATANYEIPEACWAVAVYTGSDPAPLTTAPVKSLGEGSANTLGLYDMSGNVWEWCFTANGSSRILRGGGWGNNDLILQVGNVGSNLVPGDAGDYLGFRLFRTAD